MVQAIGRGAVPDDRFRFYLEQDYQFLLRFTRVLAIAAASAPGIASMGVLSKLVTSTIHTEIDALRSLYTRFGGKESGLDDVEPAPTCEAYCNHLLASAHQRDLLVSLAAILPCHWGYHDIGLSLYRSGLPAEPRYAAWIEEYASDEYGELVGWSIETFDQLACSSDTDRINRASRAFELSSRYEYGFWQMAWTGERW